MGIQIARAAVLLLAAALRLGRLNQNGYDNEYYAAAVRSMASGWHAFLYNAFDRPDGRHGRRVGSSSTTSSVARS